ncbi:MAG: leucyl/phenylalanyl-tRNA--protein transferase [Flavobacterium sp.]|nr:MAG: leucyl/phenylalanyl-tRNA--protein transferase [Flavobacterium sp.]
MHILNHELVFPPVSEANFDGILAIGGDLSPERLMLAYRNGIFPWFNEDDPIVWWAPPQRMVLFPGEQKISRSMRRVLNSGIFKLTFNTAFHQVIDACKLISRDGQDGTWITDEMRNAYVNLHNLGFAKSVEVWKNGELVGGLYGVDLGRVFCGESMFSKISNASKAAFFYLADILERENYRILDCQVHNDHLESLGAREIPREDFMRILKGQP